MLIIDENGTKVESPDLEAGRLFEKQRAVTHRWVIDVEEQSHEEVIAKYPETGGKDVAIVVDVEEQGHWETRLESGEVVEFDGSIPDDMPKDQELSDVEQYALYVVYTEEELEEIAAKKAEAAKAEAQAAFLEEAPARVDDLETNALDQDEAITALYESMAQSQLDTDEALTRMYEMLIGR